MDYLEVNPRMTETAARIRKLNTSLETLKNDIDDVLSDIQAVYSMILPQTDIKVSRVILDEIFKYFDRNLNDLQGKSRKGVTLTARHVFHQLMRDYTHLSLEDIAAFTKRDHATVMNSTKRIRYSQSTNGGLHIHYKNLNEIINGIIIEFNIKSKI